MVLGPWGGYSNGYVPESAMTRVNYEGVVYYKWSSNPDDGALDGVYLQPEAAVALVAMLTRYFAQTGKHLRVNEGYRSFKGQQYWYNRGSNPGATPGTSNHGWGQAVDFDPDFFTQEQYNWVLANCGDFGFTKLGGPFGSFDYIHFNYSGTYTQPTPPAEQEEDPMLVYVTKDTASPWFKFDGWYRTAVDGAEAQRLVDLGLVKTNTVKVIGPVIESIPLHP